MERRRRAWEGVSANEDLFGKREARLCEQDSKVFEHSGVVTSVVAVSVADSIPSSSTVPIVYAV